MAFAKDSMKIEIDNVSFEVPPLWMVQYSKSPQLFMAYSPVEQNDTFQENGNLTIEYLPSDYTAKGYLAASGESIKAVFSDFKIISTGDHFHVYTGKLNGTLLQQIQYVYIKSKVAYILTFTATPESYGNYEKEFQSIASTFKVN